MPESQRCPRPCRWYGSRINCTLRLETVGCPGSPAAAWRAAVYPNQGVQDLGGALAQISAAAGTAATAVQRARYERGCRLIWNCRARSYTMRRGSLGFAAIAGLGVLVFAI